MARFRLALLALFFASAASARPDVDPEPPKKGVICAIKTNHGTIKVELYPDKAPVTVKNFLAYANKKFYDDLVFHRVIDGFMIQGGGYKKGLAQSQAPDKLLKEPDKPIKNESDNGLSNKRGTIVMARTSVADSATSQFFINVKDNESLDRANAPDKVGYCVFGKVIEGMDVVDKIGKAKTGTVGGMGDVPAQDVVIESVRRVAR